MREKLIYGYNKGVPEDRETAWGARLIVTQQGEVDMVWDRQDTVGPPTRTRRLHGFLNAQRKEFHKSPFIQMQENIGALLAGGRMNTRNDEEFTVIRTEDITIKANTNASAGYVYVCAYFTYAEEERE